MKEKMIGDEGLSIYARMLLNIDIVGLLGRTLLLITRDSMYFHIVKLILLRWKHSATP